MPIITGEDLRAYAHIPDEADHVEVELAAAAACDVVAEWCRRTFDKTETASASARQFRPCDPHLVRVDDFWSTTGLVVKTDTADDGTYATTWTYGTDFVLEPANRMVNGRAWSYDTVRAVAGRVFPTWTRRMSVQVTAAWGWETVPPAVTQATLLWAHRLFKRRSSPEGVLGGFADFGIARVQTGDPDVTRVTGLLAPFVYQPAMVG